MAEDKKRAFTGFIVVGITLLLIVGLFEILENVTSHGPEQIESFYVQNREQDITPEIRDSLITAVMIRYSVDNACFDNHAGIFLFHIPDHPPKDGWLERGWYMVSSYKFIQLQNKSYVIDLFNNPVSVMPDLTGIYCKQQEIKNN